ncbi:XRE family transcriptional regulator [Pseudomonas rhizoryzae]|uniref:XRE family transcriptional regulator n=1 Tax=Pseudomonas rhizoryzae TaxID=2571129 RepID=UPI001F00FC21|nr:XRE family transcriptional regulator [Pseudomonas rhizoryzae]
MTSCLDVVNLQSAQYADYLQAKSAQDALRDTQQRPNNSGMEIGEIIRQARKKQGLTLEQLAHQVGTDTGNLSRLERGKQGASQELLSKLLGALGLSLGAMDADQSNVGPPVPITSPFRQIPIVGIAQLGAEGYWTALSPSEGHINFPTHDKDAYALRLRGDSMSPAIRSGWVAIIEPNGDLVPGEYVYIKLHGVHDEGESMVKELLRADDYEVSLMSVNDAFGRRTIPWEQIQHCYPVGAIVPPSKIVQ